MKRKVLLLNALYSPNIGGVENSLREMGKAMTEHGLEVHIVCSDRNNASCSQLPPYSEEKEGFIYRYRYPKAFGGALIQWWKCYRLLRVLNRSNLYQAIICRNHVPLIAARIAGLKRIKYIVPSSVYFQEKRNLSLRFPLKSMGLLAHMFLQSCALQIAEAFVFSEAMFHQVKSMPLGKPPRILAPGVSMNRFHQGVPSENSLFKKKLGLPPHRHVLLSLGRLSEVKQLHVAIKALALLDDSYVLVIVGDGPERNRLEELSFEIGVHHRVKFFKATPEPELYYRIADAFLLLSRYEAFGQVLLEATASGVPVVAFSAAAGVRTATGEIYKDHDSLWIPVHTATPSAVSEGIIYACRQGRRRGFILERQKFLSRHSWQAMLRDLGLPLIRSNDS